MRISPLRHTLAVLRTSIGLRQQQMADLVGCSKATIQAVELNKLKLSESLAELISAATGVSLDWLLKGDTKTPPLFGGPKCDKKRLGVVLTPELFHFYRDHVATQGIDEPENVQHIKTFLVFTFTDIAALAFNARLKSKTALFQYRINGYVAALKKEFGFAENIKRAAEQMLRDAEAGESINVNPVLAEFNGLKARFVRPGPSRRSATQSKTKRSRR